MSLNIGFLLFDDLTQLDFTGPLQFLSRLPGAQTYLIAHKLEPVRTDCGPFIMPTHTLADTPQLDLICVPGGFGVDAVMEDAVMLEFVRTQAQSARYITSVCTGAFILAAAGLLKGVRATTHWRYHSYLERFGAIAEKARVVTDGRFITGGGVTAGIDFGLTVLKEMAGEPVAAAVQLGLEYDPYPPLNSGNPENASQIVLDAVEERFAPRIAAFEAVVNTITTQNA